MKCAAFVFFLLVYLPVGVAITASATFTRASAVRLAAWRHELNTVFARMILYVLGFRVRTRGAARLHGWGEGLVFAANHVGFWDMLVLSRLFPLSYITSAEVGETPVLGSIARYSGCLFSERRSRHGADAEVGAVAKALRAGISIGLFAEGTSTDGGAVAPFKHRFFKAALESCAPVVPVTINYLALNGKHMGSADRDEVAYYGEQKFIPQLLRIFRFKRVDVEVLIHDPIDPVSVPGSETLSQIARHSVVSAHRASGAALL